MAKKFIKDKPITSLEELFMYKSNYFCIIKDKERFVDFSVICNLTLGTVVDYIHTSKIFLAKVIVTEKVTKTTKSIKQELPKVETLKSNCKTTLDNIYG